MKPSWHRPVNRLYRIRNHPATVTRVEDLTARYRRVWFHAPGAVAELEVFPTLWFRLWAEHLTDGVPVQRGYTFVDLDVAAGTFAADFVLHEPHGAASAWAAAVTPGTEVEIALTPARPKVPEGTERLVLAGDITALPAINSWVEQAPDDMPIEVFVADDGHDHAGLPVSTRDGVSVTWTAADEGGHALAATIADGGVRPGAVYAWGAGEKDLVKALRGAFTDGLGLTKKEQFSQFYWFRGRSSD